MANKRIRSLVRALKRPPIFGVDNDPADTDEGMALAMLLIGAVTSLVFGLFFLVALVTDL
jgi:hypothetical protein